MNDRASPKRTITVGKIVGPHGTRGELKVEVQTQFPDRFSVGEYLSVQGQLYRIQKSFPSEPRRVIVKLDGIDSRSAAEGLRDKSITVPQDEVPSLPEGEYYHFQIIDLEVYTIEGEHLGQIVEIISTGANDVYVVAGQAAQLLIPAIDQVIKEVDMDKGIMVVQLPEGLR